MEIRKISKCIVAVYVIIITFFIWSLQVYCKNLGTKIKNLVPDKVYGKVQAYGVFNCIVMSRSQCIRIQLIWLLSLRLFLIHLFSMLILGLIPSGSIVCQPNSIKFCSQFYVDHPTHWICSSWLLRCTRSPYKYWSIPLFNLTSCYLFRIGICQLGGLS